MKKVILTLVFGVLFTSMYSQSTERYIRIIGNSQHVYNSDVTRVYFVLSEIAPNEYKKISYKSMEAVETEFMDRMRESGIQKSQIIPTNTEINKYNKTKTRSYYVDVKDQRLLEGLSGGQDEGFKVKEVKYLYTNVEADVESNLSLSAIKDAKRKAKKLCDELGMTLGKILNIEDKSSGCCNTIGESKTAETTKNYNITITFELID